MSLFALSLTGTQVSLVVLAAIAAAALVAFLFRKDQDREKLRKKESKLSSVFDTAHLPHMASIFCDLSVGDYAGATGETIHLCRMVSADTEAASIAKFLVLTTDNYWWQTDERIKDPVQWDKLLAVVEHQKKAIAAEEAEKKAAILAAAADEKMREEFAAMKAAEAAKSKAA